MLELNVQNGPINASCRSVRIQNKVIGIYGNNQKGNYNEEVKNAAYYTAEISGNDQNWFKIFNEKADKILEEFYGFVQLEVLDVHTTAAVMDNFIKNQDADPDVGLRFDDYATMAAF